MTTRRTDRRAPLYVLLAIAALGTLARVLALGERMTHWGEARLGYDVLRYAATGIFEYRPVTHGPLLYHVDRFLFELLGASDFVMRLPVAVVGGLLPVAAWLYRDHLRDLEVVVLGVLLSANPVLVYYSRFARTDVLVAAFAFTALGLFVRTRHTGDHRYLYAASAFAALAFASKANAPLYAALWVLSGLFVLDQRSLLRAFSSRPVFDKARGGVLLGRLRARATAEMAVVAVFNPVFVYTFGPFSASVTTILLVVVALVGGLLLDDAGRIADRNAVWALGAIVGAYVGSSIVLGDALEPGARQFAFAFVWLTAAAGVVGVLTARTRVGARIRRWRAPATLAVVCFAVLTLGLFAPRNPDGLGLWSALATPSQLPALVDAGLVAPIEEYGRVWLGGHHNDYMTYAVALLRTLASVAIVVVAAAVVGVLANRYGDRDELVEFAVVWGALSVAVYPVAAVVNAPWHAVHVVVALAIPAAVAIGHVLRAIPRGVRDRNPAVAGVALLVCCVVLAAPLATTAGTAYLHPQSPDNDLVQYGQPSDDFRETLDAVEGAAAANDDGPDVVYYGAYFHVDNASVTDRLPVGDIYREDDGEYDLVGENLGWYNRLPLSWYFEGYGATTDSADRRPELDALLETDPPVVVTRATHADNVSRLLDVDYSRTTFDLTQRNVSVTVFVNESATPPPRRAVDANTVLAGAEPTESSVSFGPLAEPTESSVSFGPLAEPTESSVRPGTLAEPTESSVSFGPLAGANVALVGPTVATTGLAGRAAFADAHREF